MVRTKGVQLRSKNERSCTLKNVNRPNSYRKISFDWVKDEKGPSGGRFQAVQTISITNKHAGNIEFVLISCYFTAHQILSLTGISFERKSIIVSCFLPKQIFSSYLVNIFRASSSWQSFRCVRRWNTLSWTRSSAGSTKLFWTTPTKLSFTTSIRSQIYARVILKREWN